MSARIIAALAVAFVVAWLLGVLWERIATSYWRRRADYWFGRCIEAEGRAEAAEFASARGVFAAAVRREFPRPMSCTPPRAGVES